MQPSSALDTAYAVSSMGVSVTKLEQEFKDLKALRSSLQVANTQRDVPAERMLLSKSDGILIADCLNIPELAPEVERAVWQVEKSIKARIEHKDEKGGLEVERKKAENGL